MLSHTILVAQDYRGYDSLARAQLRQLGITGFGQMKILNLPTSKIYGRVWFAIVSASSERGRTNSGVRDWSSK